MEVVATLTAGRRIPVEPRRGEDPLPSPLPGRARILPLDRCRQFDTPEAPGQIPLMLATHALDVLPKGLSERFREQRHPVLPPLSVPYDDLPAIEIDILDPELRAHEDAESGTIQQGRHEPWRPIQTIENGSDLGARENDWQPRRAPGAHKVVQPSELDLQHLAVQEQDRAQRLVLRRRADVPFHRQVGEERGDLRFPELARVAYAVKADETADPCHVRLLRTTAVAVDTDGRAHLVE